MRAAPSEGLKAVYPPPGDIILGAALVERLYVSATSATRPGEKTHMNLTEKGHFVQALLEFAPPRPVPERRSDEAMSGRRDGPDGTRGRVDAPGLDLSEWPSRQAL